MKPDRPAQGFTLIELLVVVVVMALLAAMLLPALVRQRQIVQGLQCGANLKQIDQTFKLWSRDSQAGSPPGAGANAPRLREPATADRVFARFLPVSDPVGKPQPNGMPAFLPKTLICPTDTRQPVASFREPLRNANLSYFVGVDIQDSNPWMLLAGDRNLTNATRYRAGLLVLPPVGAVGWTQELHNHSGRTLLADGSVQQLLDTGLRAVLQKGGVTNRLAVP